MMRAEGADSQFAQSGVWETLNGATFVTWKQSSMSFKRAPALLYVDTKLFVKMQFLDRYDSPGMILQGCNRGDSYITALRDCIGKLMYVLCSPKDRPDVYQVYNSLGELVAYSSDEEPTVPGFMRFRDHSKALLASALPPRGLSKKGMGRVDPYEVWFVEESESNSSLSLMQNRWVVMATIQDRALRLAHKPPSPVVQVLLVSMYLLPIILAAAFMYSGCRFIYKLVYPDLARGSEKHPFLDSYLGYGALVERSMLRAS